ncbi:MAG: hypothetical protein C0467_19240 [Planctomycetaceae bacterium]|nr:hypothetical protein [Planctomycetaceae bacterium]
MTDPITVDIPTKPRPAVPSLPPLPPLPKLADKAPEPTKAAPTPNPVATMPSAPATTDVASPKSAPKKGSVKKKLTVGASALLSLGVGAAAVHFFSPTDPTPPASPSVASVSRETTPGQLKPVVHQEQPRPAHETIPATQLPVVPVAAAPIATPAHPARPGGLPEPAQLLPAIPSAGPASPLGSPPAPTWEQDKRAGQQNHTPIPAPAFEPPARPPVITQAGGTEPGPLVPAALPMIPAAGPATPPLPAIPSAGPSTPASTPPAIPMIPAASGPAAPTLPAIPPAATPTPPPIDLAPKLPAATTPAIPPVGPGSGNPSTAPKMPLPEPGDLFAPPAKGPSTPPAPVVGTPVNGSPVVPVLPPDLGPPASTPTKPIGAPPVMPAPDLKPKPTDVGSKPEFTKPEFTKPVSSKPDPKPMVTPVAAIERSPTTSFDVDIHEPKAGDTYEAISREFYNDTRYAAALRAYNRNKPLQGSGPIDVPPLHVLKRYSQTPQPQSGVVPVSQINTTPEWGSASPSAAARTGGDKAFRIPTGGMSMRAVARLTMGNEQRWNDIYTLNPQLRPDEILPAGTELRLPADARTP